jgi:hypothetical protein
MKFKIDVKSIKYLETPRGVAFTADLYQGQIIVGTVFNLGDGGDTSIRTRYPYNGSILKQAAKDAGYEDLEFYLDSLMNEAEGVSNDIDIDALMKEHSK